MRLAKLEGSNDSWRADIHSLAGRPLGHAQFHSRTSFSSLKDFHNQAQTYELTITLGDTTLEAALAEGSGFYHGKGTLAIDGEPAARWTSDNGKAALRDGDGQTLLRYRSDSTRRRLKWALGHGLPLKQARQYSRWGDLIIGPSYFLASTVSSLCNWNTPQVAADLWNAEDAAIVETLPVREQLLLLFLCLRRLSGVSERDNFSSGLGKLMSCPDIPSFGKAGTDKISCRPAILPRALGKGERLAVFWLTGMPFLSLMGIALLAIGACFGGQALAGAAYFALLLFAIQGIVLVLAGDEGEDIRIAPPQTTTVPDALSH